MIKHIFYLLVLLPIYASAQKMGITHNLPNKIKPNEQVNAELTITKGDVNGFAKLQAEIPEGYSVKNTDAKTGSFTFENQKLKIIWISVPVEPSFTIKFNIVASVDVDGDFKFSPKFSYLQENVKKDLVMEEHVAKIENKNTTSVAQNSSSNNSENASSSANGSDAKSNNQNSTAKNNTSNNSENVSSTANGSDLKSNNVNTTAKNNSSDNNVNTSSNNNSKNSSVTNTNSNFSKSTVFKVQIGAFSGSPDRSKFKGIKYEVSEENGLSKILTGNFKNLQDAQTKKDELKAKGFDAFVVAYENGKRIPIAK